MWSNSETLVKHGFSYSGKDFIYSGLHCPHVGIEANTPSCVSCHCLLALVVLA